MTMARYTNFKPLISNNCFRATSLLTRHDLEYPTTYPLAEPKPDAVTGEGLTRSDGQLLQSALTRPEHAGVAMNPAVVL